MFDHFSYTARTAMERARHEAQRTGREVIDTEHLLAGLLHAGGGGVRVLETLSLAPSRIQAEIEKIAGPKVDSPPVLHQYPLSPGARRVLELARKHADRTVAHEVDTEHLLLGLLDEGEGAASRILSGLGAKKEDFHREIHQFKEPPARGVLSRILEIFGRRPVSK